jgi:hypothetical protein
MSAYGAPDSLITQCIDSVFLQWPDRAYFLFFGPELIDRFNEVNRTSVALEDCQMLALDFKKLD